MALCEGSAALLFIQQLQRILSFDDPHFNMLLDEVDFAGFGGENELGGKVNSFSTETYICAVADSSP